MNGVKIGKHWVSVEELYHRIVDKIPKAQFARVIKSIEKDLDKERK